LERRRHEMREPRDDGPFPELERKAPAPQTLLAAARRLNCART